MLYAQLAASFAIWIAVGWVQARRVPMLRASLARFSRTMRIVLGPAIMLATAAGLMGAGIVLMRIHGLADGSLTLGGWLLVTFTGTAFVGAQSLSAVMMLSLATERASESSLPGSNDRINDRKSYESKTSARR